MRLRPLIRSIIVHASLRRDDILGPFQSWAKRLDITPCFQNVLSGGIAGNHDNYGLTTEQPESVLGVSSFPKYPTWYWRVLGVDEWGSSVEFL